MGPELDGLDDEQLFRLCRETDDGELIRRAVGLLSVRHAAGLIRYLAGMTGSVEAAEDLCQEAFIRIYRHAREYQDIAKVRTWLYRIAQNLAKNHARDQRRKPRVSLEAVMGGGADGSASRELRDARAADPGQQAVERERAERLRDAVADLPEHYRTVLCCCDLEGLSYQEAAEILELKLGTVRSRLFRARERLAATLEESLGDGRGPGASAARGERGERAERAEPDERGGDAAAGRAGQRKTA